MLQLCVSQQLNTVPYSFKTTGIHVYTFEEMLYHVFHYWRESVDEFLADGAIAWVAEIGHSYLATRMKELTRTELFATRILDFLRLANYFDEEELSGLKATLEKWELRREWEKLKERADFFASKNEPDKAIPLYKRALQYDENAPLLNNLGVQYLQANSPKEGLSYLTRALSLEPKNFSILLHYTEAAILSGKFDKAAKALQKAYAVNPKHPDIAFLLGLMSYEQKDYPTALTYFEKAINADPTVPYYTHKAVDIHLQMRQYEKALAALQKSATHDSAYHEKEAEIHAAEGNLPRAIKSMQAALSATAEPAATAYAKLAAYHRQDYDTARAEEAITKALSLNPHNNIVLLENARIKKGLGHTREYQSVLGEILKSFKEGYRNA
ncbi:MAG: tetratricopeptide repeat protein [Defluviitaleaceae bacterium]|nr:tetratricopeptide repeat protein [Defluviitaleaceae bacterium]MCL2264272.1 tetratricopeptide repeat protein [Defluviitaleaceae bacterium]